MPSCQANMGLLKNTLIEILEGCDEPILARDLVSLVEDRIDRRYSSYKLGAQLAMLCDADFVVREKVDFGKNLSGVYVYQIRWRPVKNG